MRKITAVICIIALFLCVVPSTNADSYSAFKVDYSICNYKINEDTLKALEAAVYDSTRSVKLESIEGVLKNLEMQADVYNFTEEQVKAYLDGMINKQTIIIDGNDRGMSNSTPISTNRPDDNGIGYEVKSQPGYYQETAFLTLPTVYRNSAGCSSAYLFYTISNESELYAIDVGLWYGNGYYGTGWRDCYTINGTTSTVNDLLGVSSGDSLYLHSYITESSNGETYVRCRILDANNFSNVISDFSIWVGSGINKSTAVINRQITLCNNAADFTTGEYLHYGEFYDAYLYSTVSCAPVSASNVNSSFCGAFGTDDFTASQVTVNSYTAWDAENISIDF